MIGIISVALIAAVDPMRRDAMAVLVLGICEVTIGAVTLIFNGKLSQLMMKSKPRYLNRRAVTLREVQLIFRVVSSCGIIIGLVTIGIALDWFTR